MAGPFDRAEKLSIAEQARTLIERIEAPGAFECHDGIEPDAEKVIEAWEGTFPDEEAFERRLEQVGMTKAECLEAVRANELPANEPIPDWIDDLEEIVTAVQSQPPSINSGENDPRKTDDRLFGSLTGAIAAYTWNQASKDVPEDHLSGSAIESMVEWIRCRIEDRFWRILYAELEGNIAALDPELASATPDDFEEFPTEYYERFLSYLFTGGFADLCREHPMFARLLVTQVRGCAEQLRAFCTRSRADRDRLADRFAVDGALGNVVTAEPLTDDEFDDDRALLRVEFESGLAVAYKPRSVEPGATFYRLLDRLNDHLPVPDFETPTYLVRDDYGWMEWIEYRECTGETAVKRYYRRAGALTCIAYFLELNDCSVENLVVAGEQPLLVDVETVLQPYVTPERKPVRTNVGVSVDDNVLRTGLLPFAADDDGDDSNGLTTKLAGLSVTSEQTELEGITERVVRAANTDVMTVERQNVSVDRSENVPKVDGVDKPPGEYLEHIVDGFEGTYRAIIELRDEGHLEAVGLPSDFESLETRFLYRGWYKGVIESLTSVESLHDGAWFGVAMERLAVPFCSGEVAEPRPWSLYDAERTALKRLEKPRFTCPTDETDIRAGGRRVGARADSSGIQRCCERIESATLEDMHEQVESVRDCFE